MLADAFFSRKGALVSVKSCAFFVQAVTTPAISILAVMVNAGIASETRRCCTSRLPRSVFHRTRASLAGPATYLCAFAAQQSLALQMN